MTISMFKLLSVTNRQLCREPLPERVRKNAEGGADAIILREKDLPEESYLELARQVQTICRETGTTCILHTFFHAAEKLGAEAMHLPLPVLRTLTQAQKEPFTVLGASCHSLEDVLEAADLGCTYVTLGHIFATDCKKGLPPRGLGLLQEVCQSSPIPVYAIGGICADNIADVREVGASGACLMSSLQICPDPAHEIQQLRQVLYRDFSENRAERG